MLDVEKRRVRQVREAIDSWPSFVLHIAGRLTASADSFRVGEDVRGVKFLRAGIDDLGDFLSWVAEIRSVVEECGTPVAGANEWRGRLADGARQIRLAVSRGDLAEAADRIEASLVRELMRSGDLADRLSSDLSRIQEAA